MHAATVHRPGNPMFQIQAGQVSRRLTASPRPAPCLRDAKCDANRWQEPTWSGRMAKAARSRCSGNAAAVAARRSMGAAARNLH